MNKRLWFTNKEYIIATESLMKLPFEYVSIESASPNNRARVNSEVGFERTQDPRVYGTSLRYMPEESLVQDLFKIS